MKTITPDTLLAKIDENAPVDRETALSSLRSTMKTHVKAPVLAGDFEQAADVLLDSADEFVEVAFDGKNVDIIQVATALLDLMINDDIHHSSETVQAWKDLRDWMEEEGSMHNFKRAIK